MQEMKRLQRHVQNLEEQHCKSSRAYLEELVYWRSQRRLDDDLVVFDSSDRYMWDALDVLPENIRGLATDILVEKLRCYVTQDQAATLGELQGQITRLRHRNEALEVKVPDLEEQLTEARNANLALTTRLNLLSATVKDFEKKDAAASTAITRCRDVEAKLQHESKRASELSAEVDELKKALHATQGLKLQRELEEAKRNLEAAETRTNALARSVCAADFSNLFLRDVDRLSAEDILRRDLPKLGARVAEAAPESGGIPVREWIQAACTKIEKQFDALNESVRGESMQRVALERRLETTQASLIELESRGRGLESSRDLGSTEKSAEVDDSVVSGIDSDLITPENEEATKESEPSIIANEGNEQGYFARQLSEYALSSDTDFSRQVTPSDVAQIPALAELAIAEGGAREISADDSPLSNALSRRPSTQSYARRGSSKESASGDHANLTTDVTWLQKELKRTKRELDKLRKATEGYEEKFAYIEQLEQDLARQREGRSELHPAKVAEVTAELRKARQDAFALSTMNSTLKATIEYMQQKFSDYHHRKPHKDPVCAEARYIVETCKRGVHIRLYEDAMKRNRKVHTPFLKEPAQSHFLLDCEGDDHEHGITVEESDAHPCMRRSNSAPSRILLWGEIHDMLHRNVQNLYELQSEPFFNQALVLPDNAKPHASPCPVPLVATSPEPMGKFYDDGYQEEERIGSLVVWRTRASTPCSQATTIAPTSPSPDIPSLPNSRPSTPACKAVARPRVIKSLPYKLHEERCGQPGRPASARVASASPELMCNAHAVLATTRQCVSRQVQAYAGRVGAQSR
jgi:predicted RNase H-like nuclease (RuvC/YqgF family)